MSLNVFDLFDHHQSDQKHNFNSFNLQVIYFTFIGKMYIFKELYCCKILFLQNEWWKQTFWQQILLSWQTVLCGTTSVANLLWMYCKKVNTPHKWRSSQNGHFVKYLTEWGQAGRENKCFPESQMALGEDACTLQHSVHT